MTRIAALRFRHNPAVATAAAVMIIIGLTLGAWAPYLLPLLLIPLLVTVWAWRAGTDVDSRGITVRAALADRRVPWSDITGFTTGDDGRVLARLGAGSALTLTAVRPDDLPQIIAASGHQVVSDPG